MSIEDIPNQNGYWFDNVGRANQVNPQPEDVEGNEAQNELQIPEDIAAEIPHVSSWDFRKQQAVIWLKRTRYLVPVVAACGVAWTIRSAKSLKENQKANRER